MWICPKCGEKSDNHFDTCWKCQAANPDFKPAPSAAHANHGSEWRLTYKTYRSTLASWDELFTRAARFASDIGRERVLTISHSADDCDGVVTVWYWTKEPPETE